MLQVMWSTFRMFFFCFVFNLLIFLVIMTARKYSITAVVYIFFLYRTYVNDDRFFFFIIYL